MERKRPWIYLKSSIYRFANGLDRHGHAVRGGGEFSVGPNARTVVSFPEIGKMGRGLSTVSMRCHVVFLNGWLAAKTGEEGEKTEGDMHGEISKCRHVCAVGLGENGERGGSAALT